LTKAVEYGSYEYIGSVKDHIDPEVYRQAVIFSIPAVASSGSLEAVKELITALGAEVVHANKPDFVGVFINRFKAPAEPTMDMPAYADQVVDTMTQLDSRWYLYDREGQDISDFKYLSAASPDAVAYLSHHPVVGPLVQIAPLFPENTVDAVMREQFPLMVSLS